MNKWMAIGFLLLGATANAGPRNNFGVYIDTQSNIVFGSPAGAYNSPDSTQQIGCSIISNRQPDGSWLVSIRCHARNAAGYQASCELYNPPAPLLQVVSAMNDTSLISFRWDAQTGECTALHAYGESTQAPKLASSQTASANAALPAASHPAVSANKAND
ncbi:hypothetical protein D187_001426 [Cystobacter fuscus DSM 2262]|uniref:Uncharacterized protein n=2 Tax=Cystobacter fuscus TaxID=43 RepID=S9PEJ2_CYSF2|nr:hypothetical protein D187_001426 [Cystobacter fuscus DSM 2262]